MGMPFPSKYSFEPLVKPERVGWWAAATFLMSTFAYLVAGLLCSGVLLTWPSVSVSGATPSEEKGVCLRLTRTEDYAYVRLPMGTPLFVKKLLIEFENTLPEKSEEYEIELYAVDTSNSVTAICNPALDGGSANCTDVALVASSPKVPMRRVVVQFKQGHYKAAYYSSEAAVSLGLDGVLRLRRGLRYWITETHLCVEEQTSGLPLSPDAVLQATQSPSGSLHAPIRSLSAVEGVSGSTVATFADVCTSPPVQQAVALFLPSAAFTSSTWLALESGASTALHESTLRERSVVVELGVGCASEAASADGAVEQALDFYLVDCVPYGTCRANASVPFSAVATSKVLINVPAGDDTVAFAFEESSELAVSVPQDVNLEQERVFAACMRLLLISLASAVSYIRSKRKSASTSWIFCNAVYQARSRSSMEQRAVYLGLEGKASARWTEDLFVELAAVGARLSSAVLYAHGMDASTFSRVWYSESTAAIFSFLYAALRYACLDSDCETPVTQLGGASAVGSDLGRAPCGHDGTVQRG